jgi:hypothetical protein
MPTSTPSVQSNSCNSTFSAITLQLPSTGYAYNIYRNGGTIPIGVGGSGELFTDNSVSTSTFYSYQIQASTTRSDGNTYVSSSSTPPIGTTTLACIANNPIISGGNTINTGACTPNQTGAPAGKVFVDRQMTWTLPLPSGTTTTNTTWTGNNIQYGSPTNQNSNVMYNIYTTVGPKTIYATTTASDKNSYNCTASTTVILATSTNQEI